MAISETSIHPDGSPACRASAKSVLAPPCTGRRYGAGIAQSPIAWRGRGRGRGRWPLPDQNGPWPARLTLYRSTSVRRPGLLRWPLLSLVPLPGWSRQADRNLDLLTSSRPHMHAVRRRRRRRQRQKARAAAETRMAERERRPLGEGNRGRNRTSHHLISDEQLVGLVHFLPTLG